MNSTFDPCDHALSRGNLIILLRILSHVMKDVSDVGVTLGDYDGYRDDGSEMLDSGIGSQQGLVSPRINWWMCSRHYTCKTKSVIVPPSPPLICMSLGLKCNSNSTFYAYKDLGNLIILFRIVSHSQNLTQTVTIAAS